MTAEVPHQTSASEKRHRISGPHATWAVTGSLYLLRTAAWTWTLTPRLISTALSGRQLVRRR